MSTKDLWLEAGEQALRDEGPAAVRIDRLVVRLGRTKGSFHHHFAGVDGYREALLARVERGQLDPLDRAATELADVAPVEALRSLPARLDELFDAALDRSLRAWATEDPRAAAALERIDAARLSFIEGIWRRLVDDTARAHAAALLPHLVLIGANAARPPLDPATRRAVFDLLADLIPGV